MSPKEYKKNKKRWQSAADFGKVILNVTDGDSGIVFIAKGEGCAAIILEPGKSIGTEQMIDTWKMFRSRLDDMIRHAESGDFDPDKANRAYIRDSTTGNYTAAEGEED